MRWTFCGLSLFMAVSITWACSSSEEGSKVNGTPGNAGSGGNISIGTGGSSATTGGSAGATASGGAGNASGADPGPAKCVIPGLDPDTCGETSVRAIPKPVNIMIVLDKSGSMTDQPEGFSVSKWDATKTALKAALGKAEPTLSYGLILYPYNKANPIPLDCRGTACCTEGESTINAAIEPSATAVPKILAELDATSPGGGTPTAAALNRALTYYTSGAGAALQGDKYVLLATDGGPNCNFEASCTEATCTTKMDNPSFACGTNKCCPQNLPEGKGACLDDGPTKKAIEDLKAAGVSTFVIGIPGTEAYKEHLNAFAVAGGVPRTGAATQYYEVEASGGVDALTKVFTDITSNLIRSCDVEMTEVPPDPEKVNVAINCDLIPKEDGAAWDFDPNNPKVINIKEPRCNFIKSQGVSSIDVIFGCPTISIR